MTTEGKLLILSLLIKSNYESTRKYRNNSGKYLSDH